MSSSGVLSICYDARILAEYREVLSRPKFGFHAGQIGDLIDQLKADGMLVAAVPLKESLPDSHDEMFLEVALAGKAQCLVTGNLRDYPASKREGMPVVSPQELITLYRQKGIKS